MQASVAVRWHWCRAHGGTQAAGEAAMTKQKRRAAAGERRLGSPTMSLASLEDQLSEPVLLPGEDRCLYAAMAQAIRQRLAPSDLVQAMACADIVTLRWEILRHRRLRQKSVERWFAAEIFKIYREGDVSDPEGRRLTEDDQVRLAMATVSRDPGQRDAALEYFDRKVGIDRDQILAEAYAASPNVKVHDARLIQLMRQHRQAMRDYDDLEDREAMRDIPDAEIVRDAP